MMRVLSYAAVLLVAAFATQSLSQGITGPREELPDPQMPDRCVYAAGDPTCWDLPFERPSWLDRSPMTPHPCADRSGWTYCWIEPIEKSHSAILEPPDCWEDCHTDCEERCTTGMCYRICYVKCTRSCNRPGKAPRPDPESGINLIAPPR